MVPGKKITPLALAIMGALSSLSASADTFNNPSGDLIDYQYTASLLGIGTGDGNSGKVVISANGDVTADTLKAGISKGTGILDIINGGRLTVSGTSNLGGYLEHDSSRGRINTEGVATVNVTGQGSQFDTNALIVGANGGTGTLNITDGGKLIASGDVILAQLDKRLFEPTGARATVVVDGAGSELIAGGDITVGQANGANYYTSSRDGYGALSVTNGGRVQANGVLKIGEWSGDESGYVSSEYNIITVDGTNSEISSSEQIQIGVNNNSLAPTTTEEIESYIVASNDATVSAPSLLIKSGALVIGGTHPYFLNSTSTRAAIIDVDDIILSKPSNTYTGLSSSIHLYHNEDDYKLKSNISGYGLIDSASGNTTLKGDNSLFTGRISINSESAINVTEQKNLGDAEIELRANMYEREDTDGQLNINADSDWVFTNRLIGILKDEVNNYGNVVVNTNGNHFSFKSADLTDIFSGVLALGNTQFSLDGVNTDALSQMLLKAGDQSVITLGQGQQTIDRFAFDGGTVIFGDVAPGKTRADNLLHTTSRLDLSGTGQVQVNLTDVVNSTPALSPDVPLLAQDDGNALIQLASSDGSVIGSGGNLTLTDSSGNVISSGVVSDIVQNGVVAARGTYDYRLTSGTGSDGLYVNYGLKGIELLTAGSEALVLDAAGGTGNAADLSAQVTGSGDLAVTGQAGDVVSLSNSANDYTGVTDIRSGTLAMFNSHVLGNTQALTVAGGAGFNMNGHAQTVGRLDAAAGAVVDLNGGELTLAQGGSAAGTLAGDGHLVVAGGTLAVSGANTQLSAQTTVADGAAAVLDDVQGLGRGDISLAGTLGLNGAEGTVANSLSQQGRVALTGSQVTLAGDNSAFAGQFSVDAGSSLTAGSADQLGQAAVHSDGTLTLNAAADWTVANLIQGAGNLVKTGAGTATLTADSAGLTGHTDIQQGNLTAGSAQAPVTLASSRVTVGESGQLSGFGGVQGDVENRGTLRVGGDAASAASARFSVGGSLQNSGRVQLSADAQSAGNQLVVAGDYTGNGGSLHLNTVLGDDSAVTDRLIVKGSTAGTTAVSVTNAGGSGAQTIDGIEIITVEGRSDGEFTQNGRIVAGAYDYTLVRGQAADAGNWYLTSEVAGGTEQPDDNGKPDTGGNTDSGGNTDNGGSTDTGGNTGAGGNPDSGSKPGKESAVRPEAGSYAESLTAANTMFLTRRYDRQGQTLYLNPVTGELEETSLWMRNVGSHSRSRGGNGQLKTTANRYVVQLGGDLASGSYTGSDSWRIGAMAGYGHQSSTTRSMVNANSARSSVSGYSVGLYGTWSADDATGYGPYVDGWLQYSWFDNTVKGNDIGSESWDASGLTASLEAGYMWSLGTFAGSHGSQTEWLIQPQAQLVWMGVKADEHREANGTVVRGKGDGNVQTRLGFRTLLRGHHAQDEGKSRQFQPYAELNWIHNTREFGAQLNGVTVNRQGAKNVAELKVGVEGQLSKKLSVWANIGEQLGDKGYNETTGTLGVKYNF